MPCDKNISIKLMSLFNWPIYKVLYLGVPFIGCVMCETLSVNSIWCLPTLKPTCWTFNALIICQFAYYSVNCCGLFSWSLWFGEYLVLSAQNIQLIILVQIIRVSKVHYTLQKKKKIHDILVIWNVDNLKNHLSEWINKTCITFHLFNFILI